MKTVGFMLWVVGVMVAASVVLAALEPEGMDAGDESGHEGDEQASFAAQMVLVGMFENKQEPGMIEVTVLDKGSDRAFTLRIGETDKNGVTLVEADYERDEAMLRKGDEVVILSMRSADPGEVLSSSEWEDWKRQREKHRVSYSERRGRREAERPRELPRPRFSDAELGRKLHEAQMESIRQGMSGAAEQPSR